MPTVDFHSLPDIARAGAARFGSLPALRRAEAAGGFGFTYDELWRVVRAGAVHLRRQGLVDGDRVLVAAPPGPEWVAALSPRKGVKAYFIQHYEAYLGMPEERVAATRAMM